MAEQRNADKPGRPPRASAAAGSPDCARRPQASPRRDTPDNLWVKCPDTGEMLYRPDLEAALWVTPIGHHMRIGVEAAAALHLRRRQVRADRLAGRRRTTR